MCTYIRIYTVRISNLKYVLVKDIKFGCLFKRSTKKYIAQYKVIRLPYLYTRAQWY